MAQMTIVGCGEAFDTQYTNTSLLYEGDRTILLDCGYNVPQAFWGITTDPSKLDGIYITHIHADHSFGLPALLMWMRIRGRNRPLQVMGGAGVGAWLDKLLNLGYPGSYTPDKCFPIEPIEVTPGISTSYGECVLDVAESEHSVRNLSVRITEKGRSVAYSGDGIATAATRALFRGVHLLFHESYWYEGTDHGHSCAKDLVQMAVDEEIEKLALIHLGQNERSAIQAFVMDGVSHPQVLIPSPRDVLHI